MNPLPTFFEDIKQYVGFHPADSARLAELHPLLAPHFERTADHFYACILAHPRAHAAISGGEAQVQRLKRTLVEWMHSGLRGPHDEAFYERRARIGRRHVQINLPQQYMVTAVDVMRLDYRAILADKLPHDDFVAASNSLDRLFDLELATMLQTYQEDSEQKLRRGERLATIGQLAATIGHDLRNPLGVIESSLFIMRRKVQDDEKLLKHIEKIAKQVHICDRIVTDLLDLARNQPPKRTTIALRSAFREALDQVHVPVAIAIEVVLREDLRVNADAGLLNQVLVNLISNAVRALERGAGTITLTGEGNPTHVKIRVEDDGPGFDPDVLPLAFEPLVSTRARGIGLGLALVRSVIERHDGEVYAYNRDSGGAGVEVRLPTFVA